MDLGTVPVEAGDKRKVIAKVLQLAVEKIFACNVYTFGGQILVQEDGAPIGLDLSGEIGSLEMGETDIKFHQVCKANNIKVDVAKRYVNGDMYGKSAFIT